MMGRPELQQYSNESVVHNNGSALFYVEEAFNGIPNRTMNEYYKQAIPVYRIAVPILLAICFTALFENLFLMLSAFWVKSWNLTLKLTYSLALADAWYSLTWGTGLVMNSYLRHVLNAKFGHQDCVMMGLEAFRLGSLLTSALHLLVISINHALGTLRPIKYFNSKRNPAGECWLIMALWIIPPVLFTGVVVLVAPWNLFIETCSTAFTLSIQYRLAVLLLICTPLFAMTVVYCAIAAKLLRQKPVSRKLSAMEESATGVMARLYSATSSGDQTNSVLLVYSEPASGYRPHFLPKYGSHDASTGRLLSPASKRPSQCEQGSGNGGSATSLNCAIPSAVCKTRVTSKTRKMSVVPRFASTLKSSLLIVATFLLGWVPGAIWFAVTCASCTLDNRWLMLHRPQLVYSLGITFNLLILLKGIINPFIYGLKVPGVAKSVNLMLLRFKTTKANTEQQSLVHV